MKKNKFLRISKYKKLRYIANNYKKNLYIVFLPGFASDIDGDKPKKFLNFSIKNKLGFLALEYFGHGRSSGEFTKGNITKWSNDAKNAIRRIVKKNDFILKVYGTGPLEDELVREYSSENIIFYGEVDNDIVIDAIAKARAVITSTKSGHNVPNKIVTVEAHKNTLFSKSPPSLERRLSFSSLSILSYFMTYKINDAPVIKNKKLNIYIVILTIFQFFKQAI